MPRRDRERTAGIDGLRRALQHARNPRAVTERSDREQTTLLGNGSCSGSSWRGESGTPLASSSSMRFTDDSLHHRVVLSSDGLAIGEITKLFVDPDWRVRTFEVRLRREVADRIGVHRPLLHGATLEISTEQVQSIGDAVLLSVPAEALHYPAPTQPAESAPAQ